MAFATLQSSTTSAQATGTTSHPLTNPTGATTGSLVIHIFGTSDGSTFTWSSGWTAAVADTANGSACKLGVRWRILDGGANDSCTVTTSGSTESAAVALRYTGYDTTTPIVGAAVTTGGPDSIPDPPNCNPGSAADYVFVEGFCADDDDDTATYWSSSYTGIQQVQSASTTTSCLVAAAYRNLNASSTNPGVMALNAEEEWVTFTLAVKPGDGAEGGGGAAQNSNFLALL